ncbi:MAG: SPOR domain-containing protein [Gemmatimonadota bacterium]
MVPLLLAIGLTVPALCAAQTEPRLARAVRLAQDGMGDSARAAVERVLAATPSTDTLYPQILYARAVVAASPQEMRRDLQRVTAEYAASNWADRALLRLAQLDFAGSDLPGAARDLERLRQDYPTSPVYPQAAFWAARIYFDLGRPPSACRWLAEGLAQVGNDIEARNQLSFYNQRCAGVVLDTAKADTAHVDSAAKAAAPTPDTARAAPPAPDTAAHAAAESLPHAPAPAGRPPDSAAHAVFRIQVAAVNTRAAADSIAQHLKARGEDAIVVAEKGLYKVRIGAYLTRAAAAAALPAIRKKLGGQPFVVGP